MRTRKPIPAKRPTPQRPAANNGRVNAQTRRLLTQHYRAKHGVR